MAAKKKFSATKSNSPVQQRLWLMYPPRLIKQPFIWEVGHKRCCVGESDFVLETFFFVAIGFKLKIKN